jgi:hypothetical protein
VRVASLLPTPPKHFVDAHAVAPGRPDQALGAVTEPQLKRRPAPSSRRSLAPLPAPGCAPVAPVAPRGACCPAVRPARGPSVAVCGGFCAPVLAFSTRCRQFRGTLCVNAQVLWLTDSAPRITMPRGPLIEGGHE